MEIQKNAKGYWDLLSNGRVVSTHRLRRLAVAASKRLGQGTAVASKPRGSIWSEPLQSVPRAYCKKIQGKQTPKVFSNDPLATLESFCQEGTDLDLGDFSAEQVYREGREAARNCRTNKDGVALARLWTLHHALLSNDPYHGLGPYICPVSLPIDLWLQVWPSGSDVPGSPPHVMAHWLRRFPGHDALRVAWTDGLNEIAVDGPRELLETLAHSWGASSGPTRVCWEEPPEGGKLLLKFPR